MKKNISINISGIIFHIEEDGYEKLKNYLESINKYFSTFEDSGEIISDIEMRIAEIFLKKLNNQKQVIALEDVDNLMATMGSIRDFQTMEDGEVDEAESTTEEQSGEKTTGQRIARDLNRRIITGVCAGLGAHFHVDPLTIRLIFIIVFLSGFYTNGTTYAITAIIYIIFSVVFPGSREIQEDKKLKKLFRSSDDRVLAGVSSGLAAYFAVDVTIIRIIFILTTFFFFTGAIAYLILWIITPEAKSITDKVEMQGNPVTLSNIESSLRKNLNVKDDEENLLIKILLFPFRILSQVFMWMSKALGPFLRFTLEAVRVLAGVILTLISFPGIIVFTIFIFVGLNAMSAAAFFHWDLPINLDALGIPEGVLLPVYLQLVIPLVFILMAGISIIRKKKTITPQVGWPLFAVWMISGVVLLFTFPDFVYRYRDEGKIYEESSYGQLEEVIHLDINAMDETMEYEDVSFLLYPAEDSLLTIENTVYSRGISRSNAQEFARKTIYGINRANGTFVFDNHLKVANENYRFQRIDVSIAIPEQQKFTISPDFVELIEDNLRYKYGIDRINAQDTLYFSEGEIIKSTAASQRAPVKINDEVPGISDSDDFISLEPFDEIVLIGPFIVELIEGENNGMRIEGNERAVREMSWNIKGEKFEAKYRKNWDWDIPFRINEIKAEEIKLIIQIENLEKLEAKGATRINSAGLSNVNNLSLELAGGVDCTLNNVTANQLDVSLIGASKLTINGTAEELDAEILGASLLRGRDMKTEESTIEAIGASICEIWVTRYLDAEASGASKISYRGSPRIRDRSGLTGILEKN